MFGDDFLQRALLAGPVILFSLTVHEFSHAWTANKFGDPTAKNLGRMSLNPLVHLDLVGTIVLVMSQFRFGWAKPVPVNPMNLRNPRVADIWISAAGPLSNIGLAIIAGILFRMIELLSGLPLMFGQMLTYAVWINCTLAFFNLIPVFPLDGSHILRNLLPPESQGLMQTVDKMGPFILLLLMISGTLWYILGPPVSIMANIILG